MSRAPAQPPFFSAVLAAAQALRDEWQAREARQARITELLAAEGLQQHQYTCYDYVRRGAGSEEAAVAAARASAERRAAEIARRARIGELLAAEGLERFAFLCEGYILHGNGSEEEAVAGAREAQQEAAAARARVDALVAALQAEGIPFEGAVESATAVYRYVDLGSGTLEAGEAQGQPAGQGAAWLGAGCMASWEAVVHAHLAAC